MVKTLNQSWQVHKTSPEHIQYKLNNTESYLQVTGHLQRNLIKEPNIFLELCGTWYLDIVPFQEHKAETEHANRVRDLANWPQASKDAGNNLSDWKRVPKIKKTDTRNLSKVIQKIISKQK